MPELWDIVWGRQYIDARAMADALETTAQQPTLDFRTRMLIQESAVALRQHWGSERIDAWLARSPAGGRIQEICRESLGERGFPFLREALVDATKPETVTQLFRELGASLRKPVRLAVGGSVALIMPGYLVRTTQDIDVVDERQSRFLPAGWQNRLHTLEPFGRLRVGLVDVVDVFLSKLFSARVKDLDDLRVLLPQLERETILRRLGDTCEAFNRDPLLRPHAERNWYILTGETLT